MPGPDVLKVVEAFSNETNYTVWNDFISNMSLVGAILQYSDCYPSFQAFCTKLYEPIGTKLGWKPIEGESKFLFLSFFGDFCKCYSFSGSGNESDPNYAFDGASTKASVSSRPTFGRSTDGFGHQFFLEDMSRNRDVSVVCHCQ